jgi:hypothetical protein
MLEVKKQLQVCKYEPRMGMYTGHRVNVRSSLQPHVRRGLPLVAADQQMGVRAGMLWRIQNCFDCGILIF